jgi:fructose-specific phosphotransferase system IIC component
MGLTPNIGLNKIPPVKGYVINLTLNLICIAIFYLFLGAAVSYMLSKLFADFDENWKKLPNWRQALDVALEIALIAITAFWTTYVVHVYIPVLPVTSGLEGYLESFGGQMIFVYAVFLFLGTLDDKMKHVFEDIFGQIK